MVDAIINGIGPVGLVKAVQTVAVRKVDFGGTDASDTKKISNILRLVSQKVTYARLEVNTARTTSLDRRRALIILRTIMKGMGKINRSLMRLAHVTHMSISPIRCRPMQRSPPKVVGFQVLPVCGGQVKM